MNSNTKQREAVRRCFHPSQWFCEPDGDGVEHMDTAVEIICCGNTSNPVCAEGIKAMWVYFKNQDGRYEVGFFTPNKVWCRESDFSTPREAAERAHWLNGGQS